MKPFYKNLENEMSQFVITAQKRSLPILSMLPLHNDDNVGKEHKTCKLQDTIRVINNKTRRNRRATVKTHCSPATLTIRK